MTQVDPITYVVDQITELAARRQRNGVKAQTVSALADLAKAVREVSVSFQARLAALDDQIAHLQAERDELNARVEALEAAGHA